MKKKEKSSHEKKLVTIGVTGSIAAYKAPEIVSRLLESGFSIQVIMTKEATFFISPLTLQTLSRNPVIVELFPFTYSQSWRDHVDLAEETALLLIAPATANIISKLSHGIADDMLTTFALTKKAPILIAPAMNERMFKNPILQENIKKLRERGVKFIQPEYGRLACGMEGVGRLAKIDRIVDEVRIMLQRNRQFEGKTFLITAGPTQEPIDPIRYISNRSTGKMGFALACAARNFGGEVVLVSGPTTLEPPSDVKTIFVRETKEMREAVLRYFEESDVAILAAAVSDYRVEHSAPQKIKAQKLTLNLVRNPDILKELGERKGERILVGFSLETEEPIPRALEKLKRKNLDMIVINDPSGLGSDTNKALFLDRWGGVVRLPLLSKPELSERILERIAEFMKRDGGKGT